MKVGGMPRSGVSASAIRVLILAMLGLMPASRAISAPSPATPAAPAADPTAAAEPQDALPAQGDLRFRVDIEAADVSVGRPFTVKFEVTYPAGTRVYFPESPAVAPMVLVQTTGESSAVLGSGTFEKHALTLLPVRVGAAVLPSIEVPYVAASGEAKVAATPEVRVQVVSTLGDETAPELASSGTPVPVRVRNQLLLWILAGLGVSLVTAVASILGYRRLKAWLDSRRPPPPPRPAHEVAFERLAEIEAMGLVESGDFQQLALLVSEVLREFMGATFGFAGIDLTTWEVLRVLEGRDLRRLSRPELEDFLSLCDLIKFAKYAPSIEEASSLVRRARDAVERVMAAPAIPSAGEG